MALICLVADIICRLTQLWIPLRSILTVEEIHTYSL
jgi:hypothetical protein